MAVDKIALTNEDMKKLISESSNKFNSTMLEIINNRVSNIKPSTLLKNYNDKYSFFKCSSIDPRIYNEISNKFFDAVDDDFECIELSPINPLGLNSTLTPINQNNILSCIKNSEVISDSSISMALECAYRIRKNSEEKVNLASSTRLLRMQNYGTGKKSHWTQHFRACSLVSSFRNIQDNIFESLSMQINNWLRVINNLKSNIDIANIDVNICYIPLVMEIYTAHGIDVKDILTNSVNPDFNVFTINNIDLKENISNLSDVESLKNEKDYLLSIRNIFEYLYNKLFLPMKKINEKVNFNLQLNRKSGLNYYDNMCYEIVVQFCDNNRLVLVDGGVTNWTGILLSDGKEKCITSGMGLEYISKVYKR